VGDILFALAVFGVYWACRGAIMASPYWLARYLGHLFGIGIPIAVIGNPICYYLHHWIKCKMIAESTRMAFSERIANLSQPGAYQNPFKATEAPQASPVEPEPPPILNEVQIEQLNLLRQRTNILDAKRFPHASFNGVFSERYKVVPKAGVFTSKFRYKAGNKPDLDIVVMMATVQGARAFEQAYRNMSNPAYRVEGYELPARTGACYRVVYTTYFRLGDTVVISQ
jgi:hypothetical protein